MKQYTGSITFLYYNDYEYGKTFITEVLGLTEVMDQGWASVYLISGKSFVGVVSKKEKATAGDTLLSLNTTDVEKEYQRIKKLEVMKLTEIQFFESIPLKSFFFEDKEGHRFEIQEFLNKEDKKKF